jgi:ligand-binding sensor domain-containing protein
MGQPMKQIISLLVFLYACAASAQSTLRLQHITVDDGLSQSSVNYIFQDSRGFIWFATGDGLDRYDGRDFIVYKSHFGDTLASQMKDRDINSKIFEDKYNKIWLATDGGLAFLNTKNTSYKVVLDKYAVQNDAMLIGVEGDTVWSAVTQDGFYAVNTVTLQHNHYPLLTISSGVQTGFILFTTDW